MEEKETKPTLTNEQKLKIAIAHREFIRAEGAANLAERVKQEALANLSRVVDQIGIDLGLARGKYTVNIDQLELLETEPRQ